MRGKFIVLGSMLAVLQAGAATITWGTAQDITGDSDVQVTGEFHAASSVEDISETLEVNGVVFTGGNDTSLIEVGGKTHEHFVHADLLTGMSRSYQNVLDGGHWGFSTITLKGLTVNQKYLVQIWSTDTRDAGKLRGTELSTAGGLLVTLDQNDEQGSSYGQWVTGTFIADATTQTINFSSGGPGDATINAVMVQDISESFSVGMLEFYRVGPQMGLSQGSI